MSLTAAMADRRFLRVWVTAQDPAITDENGGILMREVSLPVPLLLDGPKSSRFEVIDYDVTTDTLYAPAPTGKFFSTRSRKPPRCMDEAFMRQGLRQNPQHHQVNVFAIAASTLFEFEKALGRTVEWGFDSHQLKILPHAFRFENAFYSRRDQCIAFGYFPDSKIPGSTVFTCLSHDIIVHEMTHAILDGLRGDFGRESSVDQAAFHEGYADIIALLSVLRSEELIATSLSEVKGLRPSPTAGTLSYQDTVAAIDSGLYLTSLAEEFGRTTSGGREAALRRSAALSHNDIKYANRNRMRPHDLGQLLVAAVIRSFTAVWAKRLKVKTEDRIERQGGRVPAWRVHEEGAKAARHLMSLMIRAIDYLPPVHMDFGDFLSAVLTADKEVCPDDTYGYRDILLKTFALYGVQPAVSSGDHTWGLGTAAGAPIRFNAGNMDINRWSREAIFRLIWENQDALGLSRDVYTRVNSVRPCWRIGPDGYVLRETVVEYTQILKGAAAVDVERIMKGAQKDIPVMDAVPAFMRNGVTVDMEGGGTLIFDEFGNLKFHIHNRLCGTRQPEILQRLWSRGHFSSETHSNPRRAMTLHLARAGFPGDAAPASGAEEAVS